MFAYWKGIAEIKKRNRTGFSNGGWAYDAYPKLEKLDAHKSITIAEIKGPAVITCIHTTQQLYNSNFIKELSDMEHKAIAARGIILEVYYNEIPVPAVRVPLGDFFTDGCGGNANHFTNLFVEKAPGSYNCFIPMPFEKSARVILRNETSYDFPNYSFVEFEQIPDWDDSLGYFHATWSRFAFQLNSKTDHHFIHINGTGHLLGRSWSICTDEPLFRGYYFVMEGNNEIRIDSEKKPRIDYLGTEDSFGLSWGFQKEFSGLYNGINFIKVDDVSKINMLSIYRFFGQNVIRFNKSFDLRIDWSNELLKNEQFQKELAKLNQAGGGWIDYSTTYYWYQQLVGYEHSPLLKLDERCKTILHPRR
jgi:hypothetical protein